MIAKYEIFTCFGKLVASVVFPVSSDDFICHDDNAEQAAAVRCAGFNPGRRCSVCNDNAYHAKYVGPQVIRNLTAPTTVAEM